MLRTQIWFLNSSLDSSQISQWHYSRSTVPPPPVSWASPQSLFLQNGKNEISIIDRHDAYRAGFNIELDCPYFSCRAASGWAFFSPLKVTARFTLCQSFCCRIADRMWTLCLADWYRLNRWIHFWFTVTVLCSVHKKVCKCLSSFRQKPFQTEWHLSTSFGITLSRMLIYNLIGVRESGLYLGGVSPLLGCFLLLWALLMLALQWLCGYDGMSWIFSTCELRSSEE